MVLIEILKVVEESRLSSPDFSLTNLQSMLKVCASHRRGQMSHEADHALVMIRDEIARRESITRHEALLSEQVRLKASVDRLLKPHPLVWWTFTVALLTLIVCVIGYWDQIARLFLALKFWK